MPAYVISICRGVADRARLEQYWAHSRPTFEGFDAKLLAVYTQVRPLEARGPVEGVVLVAFPSMESATRWYESLAYQVLLERFKKKATATPRCKDRHQPEDTTDSDLHGSRRSMQAAVHVNRADKNQQSLRGYIPEEVKIVLASFPK